MALAVATYQRVSKKEQANDSEAFTRQGWQLDRAVERFAPDMPRLKFWDIQTGRRDDRPGFQELLAAIAADKISILIVTRIDRLGRDLETSAKFQKILEQKKIKVYETTGKYIDWNNSNDWSYYSQAGLESERESRKLSERIIQTYDWQRSQKKLAGGMVGFPYKRDENGYLIPDPNNWQIAIEFIKLVIQHNGATMGAIAEIRAMGIDKTRNWLSNWIRSPLIRGHTPIHTHTGSGTNRKKKKAGDIKLFRDTHLSLFADPQLIGAEAQIDRIIADAPKYKGKAASRQLLALSSLIYCARCGLICHLKICRNKRAQTRIYAICSARNSRGISCGNEYGKPRSKTPLNTRYQDIESAVRSTLTARAAELIDLAIATSPQQQKSEPPEVTKLRAEIAKLQSANDPDLKSAIEAKTERLNRLLLAEPTATSERIARDTFVRLFATGDTLSLASEHQKQIIYREWISRVEVDREQISVRLKV